MWKLKSEIAPCTFATILTVYFPYCKLATVLKEYVRSEIVDLNPKLKHWAKLLPPISPQSMDKQSSPYYQPFILVTLSYHRKVNLVVPLHAEKVAAAGCLHVFIIRLPATNLIETVCKAEEKNRKNHQLLLLQIFLLFDIYFSSSFNGYFDRINKIVVL